MQKYLGAKGDQCIKPCWVGADLRGIQMDGVNEGAIAGYVMVLVECCHHQQQKEQRVLKLLLEWKGDEM
jgi:hypothetical protein